MRAVAVVALILPFIAAFAHCGGGIQPYWADDDAGRCVEHASRDYCHVSVGPCTDAGPPEPDGNADLANSVLKCSN